MFFRFCIWEFTSLWNFLQSSTPCNGKKNCTSMGGYSEEWEASISKDGRKIWSDHGAWYGNVRQSYNSSASLIPLSLHPRIERRRAAGEGKEWEILLLVGYGGYLTYHYIHTRKKRGNPPPPCACIIIFVTLIRTDARFRFLLYVVRPLVRGLVNYSPMMAGILFS